MKIGINNARRIAAVAAIAIALSTVSAFGQAIRGTVSDPSGAAVSGASITATNSAAKFQSATKSGDKGFYNFPELPTGDYDITVDADGFEQRLLRNVSVTEGAYDLNIEMKPEAKAETSAAPAPPASLALTLPGASSGTAIPENIRKLPVLKDDMDDLIRYYSSFVWWYEDEAGEADINTGFNAGEAAAAKLKEYPRGALSGTVKFRSGAAASGAVIAANMVANGKLRAITVSNDKGVYNFPELPVGDYLITVEHSLFDPNLQRNVRVRAGVYDLNIEIMKETDLPFLLPGNIKDLPLYVQYAGDSGWHYAVDPAYDLIANRILAATLGKSAIARAKKCPCGTLRGTVKDASGATVFSAYVTATNITAGGRVSTIASVDGTGFYNFPELQTGDYGIRIWSPMIEPQLLRNISVGSGVNNLNILNVLNFVITPEAKAETSAAPAPPTSLALTLPSASSVTAIPDIRALPIKGDMDDLIRYYSSSVLWYEDEVGEAALNAGFYAGEAAADKLKECPCGAIRGTIKNPSGAAVPNAIVIAANMSADGKLRAITLSNDKGVYNFPELPAGDYIVTAEYSDFDPNLQQNLQRNVSVGTDVYDLNIEMEYIALPIFVGNIIDFLRVSHNNGAVSWRYAEDPTCDPITNRIFAATLGKSAIARAKKCPCGAIRGTVKDTSGAAVFGGATITATNITAGGRVSAITSTDETGFYNFPELQTGDYEIKVESSITPALFETQILRNISVGVDVNNLNIVVKPF